MYPEFTPRALQIKFTALPAATNAQWKLVPQVTYRDGFRISSQGPAAPDHGGAQGGVVPKATVTAGGGRGLLNFGFHRMGLVS